MKKSDIIIHPIRLRIMAALSGKLLTTQEIDGIWTSGIDYSVVEQFPVAGVPYIPIVGADNNAFIGQLLEVS